MRVNIKTRLAHAEHSARLGFCSAMTVHALLADTVTWSAWRKVESDYAGKYRVGVFGLDRADGGFAVVTFRYPGQFDHSTSYYYEEYRSELAQAYHEGAAILRDCLYEARAKSEVAA